MSEDFDRTIFRDGQNAGSPRDADSLRPHLASLRRSVGDTPDFTRSVLAEVGQHRAWLDSRERWWVWIARIGAAAAAVALAAGIFIVQRTTDVDAIGAKPEDRPLTHLVQSVSNDTQRVDVRGLESVNIGRAVLANPIARVMRAADRPHRTANVWAIQRIGVDSAAMQMATTPVDDRIMPMHQFATMPGIEGDPMVARAGAMLLPQGGQATQWTGSVTVPAAFQSAPIHRTSYPRAD